MKRAVSAFTVLELLVTISLVALLGALAFPTIVSAKRRAMEAKSISQMKQLHSALMLYVEREAGEGPNGLGLPPDLMTLIKAEHLPKDIYKTGGSGGKTQTPYGIYRWMPPTVDDAANLRTEWKEYVSKREGNPVILVDESFSPEGSLFSIVKGRGLFFDGTLEVRHAPGSLGTYEKWR